MIEILLTAIIIALGAITYFGYRFISSIENKIYAKIGEIGATGEKQAETLKHIADSLNYKEDYKKVIDKLLMASGQTPIYSEPRPPVPPTHPKSNLQMIADEVGKLEK